MQRKILFTLFVVAMLALFVAVPVMAGSLPDTFEILVRSDADSARVLVTTAPAAPVEFQPKDPMQHYTCYYEGVRIPCSFLSWLWDPWF